MPATFHRRSRRSPDTLPGRHCRVRFEPVALVPARRVRTPTGPVAVSVSAGARNPQLLVSLHPPSANSCRGPRRHTTQAASPWRAKQVSEPGEPCRSPRTGIRGRTRWRSTRHGLAATRARDAWTRPGLPVDPIAATIVGQVVTLAGGRGTTVRVRDESGEIAVYVPPEVGMFGPRIRQVVEARSPEPQQPPRRSATSPRRRQGSIGACSSSIVR